MTVYEVLREWKKPIIFGTIAGLALSYPMMKLCEKIDQAMSNYDSTRFEKFEQMTEPGTVFNEGASASFRNVWLDVRQKDLDGNGKLESYFEDTKTHFVYGIIRDTSTNELIIKHIKKEAQ